MKHALLTMAVAAQFAATTGFAQTAETDMMGTGTDEGSFGQDWSPSLGLALFGADGSTVRTPEELSTQWQTLSEEDRNMIVRDCLLHMQAGQGATTDEGSQTGTAGTQGTTTEGMGGTTTGAGTDATSATGTTTTETGTATGSASDTATGAGAGTGTDAGTATGAEAGAGTDTATDTTTGGTGSSMMTMSVTAAQMDQICAATQNL